MGLAHHIGGVLQRAVLRHWVMARLARSTWGLEAGILRSAHATLLTSLTAYALAVVGSGAYEKKFRKLGTRSTNVSARRITGAGRSARLETLHMAPEIWSITNQYLQHVAFLMVPAVTATECSRTDRPNGWLQRVYGAVEGFFPERRVLQLEGLRRRTVGEGVRDTDLGEEWIHFTPGSLNAPGEELQVESLYYTDPRIFRQHRELRAQTYSFGASASWYTVGLQVLVAAGWRPDCTAPEHVNVGRSAPPVFPEETGDVREPGEHVLDK